MIMSVVDVEAVDANRPPETRRRHADVKMERNIPRDRHAAAHRSGSAYIYRTDGRHTWYLMVTDQEESDSVRELQAHRHGARRR